LNNQPNTALLIIFPRLSIQSYNIIIIIMRIKSSLEQPGTSHESILCGIQKINKKPKAANNK